ncbi:MAG: transporter substrate-binding domain-containing protein, partial [Thermodesulfobacteriota bacterium]
MMNRIWFYLLGAVLCLVAVSALFFLGNGSDDQEVAREQAVQGEGVLPGDMAPGGEKDPAEKVAAKSPGSEGPAGLPEDLWSRKKWLGDYPEMIERRMIRVLVPPSKTFFFLDKGKKRGLTYDNLMGLEKFLNQQLKSRHLRLKMVVIPTSRRHLLEDLEAGYGDIAAGNLTITPGRLEHVDFTDPLASGVSEILVSHARQPQFKSVFDLSGREVHVRRSS